MNTYKNLIFVLLTIFSAAANAQLVADFAADHVAGCAPIRVVFSDKSSGTNASTSYRWDLGNGTIALQTQSPSGVYLEPGTYTVKLTISNGSDSATITKTAFITAYAVPQPDFNALPVKGCSPLPVLFQDLSKPMSGEMVSWKWDFGDGVLGTGSNPSHVYASPGNFKVTLIAENSKGCTNFFSKLNYINVYPPTKVRFATKAPGTCMVPSTFTFTDNSTGAPVAKYLWDFGDGTSSADKNPSHTYTMSGNYTVKLVTENASGCIDSLVMQNVVNAASHRAGFLTSAATCVDVPVSFINTSSPASLPQTYTWNFGNGTFSTTKNPMVTYNTPGVYTIKLVATIGGCPDSTVQNITVHPKPSTNFSTVTTGTCKPPLIVQFNNLTTDGKVVKWFFGNGDSSTADNPTATYNDYGSYDVRLVVMSPAGCYDTLTKTSFIGIKEPVANLITGLPHGGCIPFTDTFNLELDSPEPVVKYEWDFGDNTYSNDKNPMHTYSNVGIYKVFVKITTASGCTDTISSTVSGGLRPKAGFERKPQTVCPQDYVRFTSLGTGKIDGWEWSFGDGGSSLLENPVHTYTDTGWMTVKLIVSDRGCPDSLEYKKYVYVKPPIARFIDSFTCGNQFQHRFIAKDLGAKYWQWFIDDKDMFEGKSIDYTFADAGVHKVRLYVSNDPCFDNTTRQVLVLDEKAAFTTKEPDNCLRPDLLFTVTGPKTHPENIREYKWDFGDSTATVVTTEAVISHRYAKSGMVQVKLVITDLNGCVDSCITPVQVGNYGPKANFGAAFTPICAGNKVIFSDSSTTEGFGPIVKWTWNFGEGPDVSSTAGPFTHIYNNPAWYDVRLVVENEAGCRDTLLRPRAVAVYKPVANFQSPDTLVCANAPARFYNLSGGSLVKAVWSFGDGNTSTVFNAENKYAKAGLYGVKLVVTDVQNCVDSIFRPKYIHVANAKAIFSVSDTFSACPPLLAKFSNSSVNNLVNSWDFANGNTSGLASPSHTYTLAGDFNVKLKVVGNGGCSDSAYKLIHIQGPSGTFSYNPLYRCIPLKASFDSRTKNAAKITWDFSDGNTLVGTETTASHVYQSAGRFVPRLILTDDKGCQVPIQGPDTIKAFDIKTSIKSLPTNSFCDSAMVQFSDSTVTADVITGFKWDFDDGSQTSERNPAHHFTKPGLYNIRFSVRTLGGCSAENTIAHPVVVSATPVIEMKGDSTVCLPSSLQFEGFWQNRDTSTLTYKWGFGVSQSSALLRPLPVTYSLPGKYMVTLIATNRYGCADTASKLLIVNDTPRVAATPDAYICLGDSVVLKATGASVYKWDSSPTLSCLNCASPAANPTTRQWYRVTGTDINGCKASGTVFVNVKAPAHLSVGPGDTLCMGESFRLWSAGTELYKWEPAAGLSSGNMPSPLSTPHVTTRYMIVGYDSLGCFYDTGYVPVVVYPIPKFNIIEDKIVASTGTVLTLNTSSSADITTWRWQPAIGLNCINCAEPTTTVRQPITYTGFVANKGGCTAQDAVTIVPMCNKENIFVPNTFSPNGDGQNDVFYPRGKGLAAIKAMRIFNRWGELLFEQKDFVANDASSGWNGTHRGVRLVPDVYVYVMDVLCENNTVFNVKGNVTLLK